MIGKIYSSVIPYYDRIKKQTTVHQSSLTTEISDMKKMYEDLYLDTLEKLDDYNKKVMNDTLA